MTKKVLFSKTMLLIAVMVVGVTSAWADTYKLTIQASIFNGTSYATNNNEKTSYAVCTTDATKTFEVKWTSNQMMRQGETIQWQKNSAYLYNSTNLGTIIEVKITGNVISYLTTYYGTSSNPSSNTTVGGGFFKIKNGDYTTTTSKIEVTFSPYTLTAISNNEAYGTVSLSGNKITANPETGYRISKTNPYTVTSGTATVEQNDEVFTVTADTDCTVQINFEEIPSHTATFKVNGIETGSFSVSEDESILFPANSPEDVGSYKFKGWAIEEITGKQDEAPELVTAANMGETDIVFYAVYAKETQGNAVETLTQTLQYDTWTYEGATSNKTSYRLFGDNSYVESAVFDLSTLNKVIVYGGTYGGDSYKSLTIGDGTNIWKNVSVSGKDQTKANTFTNGNKLSGSGKLYITSKSGNGSSTGVRISKIEIFCMVSPITYTDYCTTLAEPITIGSTGYATYSGSSALNFANSDVTAYTVKYENGSAKLTAVEQVPAGAGVVLRANQGEYNINLLASADELSNNDLQVSDGTKTGNGTYFCLANGNNGVGFYRVGEGVTIPAGKCYLEVPSSSRQFIGFDDNTTSIDNATEEAIVRNGYFDLQGRQVAHPTKGLYIVNGKKVIIK